MWRWSQSEDSKPARSVGGENSKGLQELTDYFRFTVFLCCSKSLRLNFSVQIYSEFTFLCQLQKNQVKYSVSFSASATEVNKVAKALLITLYLTKCTCNNLTNSIQYCVFHTWLPATGSPPTACDTVSGTFSFFDPLSHYLNSFWKD